MRLETIVRTFLYVLLTGLIFIFQGTRSEWWSGVITGALAADYLTWLFFTIPGIFDCMEEGAWEAMVNLAAGIIIFNYGHIAVPRGDDGLVGAFFAFFVVFAVKAAYRGCRYFIASNE